MEGTSTTRRGKRFRPVEAAAPPAPRGARATVRRTATVRACEAGQRARTCQAPCTRRTPHRTPVGSPCTQARGAGAPRGAAGGASAAAAAPAPAAAATDSHRAQPQPPPIAAVAVLARHLPADLLRCLMGVCRAWRAAAGAEVTAARLNMAARADGVRAPGASEPAAVAAALQAAIAARPSLREVVLVSCRRAWCTASVCCIVGHVCLP